MSILSASCSLKSAFRIDVTLFGRFAQRRSGAPVRVPEVFAR
ncbi:hypothetical protein [Pandoraea apista]|nr:hypothetical protein [Pandoraea apista]